MTGGSQYGKKTIHHRNPTHPLRWDHRKTSDPPSHDKRHPREHTLGILWIHGGGYVTGVAQMIYMSRALNLVRKYGAVVVTPEYRLAGKAPYPAALADCYAAEHYFAEQESL